jgi:hypothetical protein
MPQLNTHTPTIQQVRYLLSKVYGEENRATSLWHPSTTSEHRELRSNFVYFFDNRRFTPRTPSPTRQTSFWWVEEPPFLGDRSYCPAREQQVPPRSEHHQPRKRLRSTSPEPSHLNINLGELEVPTPDKLTIYLGEGRRH